VSYNASAVKIYNATSSLMLFKNKNIFFYFEINTLAYYNAGIVVVYFIVCCGAAQFTVRELVNRPNVS
jgi:hypothetical protein